MVFAYPLSSFLSFLSETDLLGFVVYLPSLSDIFKTHGPCRSLLDDFRCLHKKKDESYY